MKACLFFLITFVLGFTARAQEFKIISRSYVHLESLDLGDCLRSYELLHGNWMRCQFSLPGMNSAPGGISAVRYDTRRFTFADASGKPLSIDIAYINNFFSGESLIASADYGEPGTDLIANLPADKYSADILVAALRKAFAQMPPWTSSLDFVAIPAAPKNPWIRDHVYDSVWVVRRERPLSLQACQAQFQLDERPTDTDQPDWVSICQVDDVIMSASDLPELPLDPSRWGPALQDASPDVFWMEEATFRQSNRGYEIEFAGKRSWPEVEPQVKALLNRLNSKAVLYLLVPQKSLWRLDGKDQVLGELTLQKGLLDFQRSTSPSPTW